MPASNTPSYVLRYFAATGIAETSRLLLTASNVDWTEEHPEWPQAKADQPFGRLPVLLESDGSSGSEYVLSESPTIERYLARKHGFIPNDLQLASRQEEIRDQQRDVFQAFLNVRKFEGEAKQEALKAYHNLVDKMFEVHSRILRENGNNGFHFGNDISFVDLGALALVRTIIDMDGGKLEQERSKYLAENLTPEFKKLVETLESNPKLQAHISETKILSLVSSA
ncbi:hypothetical protein GGI15_002290 [Coemansia interrupta]|uniref:Glutathione S-transferase n=1 Tax=Coemansia interrupta TaxID=1126814 RepID=A0A9W8HGA6_9FUNG|nr:hypothetical protein GGI15_002290 [Coemansia interrupta]